MSPKTRQPIPTQVATGAQATRVAFRTAWPCKASDRLAQEIVALLAG